MPGSSMRRGAWYAQLHLVDSPPANRCRVDDDDYSVTDTADSVATSSDMEDGPACEPPGLPSADRPPTTSVFARRLSDALRTSQQTHLGSEMSTPPVGDTDSPALQRPPRPPMRPPQCPKPPEASPNSRRALNLRG